MAIAGSGGWIPARKFRLYHGTLIAVGLGHNMPKDKVCQDMHAAAQQLVNGDTIAVHTQGDRIGILLKHIEQLLRAEMAKEKI